MLDQKSFCPKKKFSKHDATYPELKATTMQKFEAIYSGPEFFIHYRLAYIINIIYIAFFYGPG